MKSIGAPLLFLIMPRIIDTINIQKRDTFGPRAKFYPETLVAKTCKPPILKFDG